MHKLIVMSGTAVAVAAAAWALAPIGSRQAAAQSGQFSVITADFEIVAADFDKYVALAKENAAVSIKDPGCLEFNIAVSPKNPNHVYIFEIWENAAALGAHRATDHLKAYLGATKDMVAKRDITPMWSVAVNGSSPAHSGLLINAVNLDVVPAQFDAFMALAKVNGAATPKDPGAHEFNIAVSQTDPHHVMLYEVYDNAAALDAHRATEHFKTYAAATKDMVASRKVDQLSSVGMNRP
jgi:(4S)-4-hydroxy-5-phosphonooxypentane-2,3-dione isomerase